MRDMPLALFQAGCCCSACLSSGGEQQVVVTSDGGEGSGHHTPKPKMGLNKKVKAVQNLTC